MRAEGWSPSRGKARAALAALTCGFLASCTATSGPGFDMAATPSYNGGGVVSLMADVAQSKADGAEVAADTVQTVASSDAGEDGTRPPEQVAMVPANTPVTANGQASATQRETTTRPAEPTEQAAPAQRDAAVASAQTEQPVGNAQPETAKAASVGDQGDSESVATAATDGAGQQVASAEEPKKKGFLAYFFSPQPARAAPSPIVKETPSSGANEKTGATSEEKPIAAANEKTPLIDPEEKAKPIIKLASVDPAERSAVRKASVVPMDSLPGVRANSLFEIRHKNGIDDDSDVDVHEEVGVYEVASAAGLARLAPNGLLKARESVDTACLKPALVRMLKTVEQRFGKKFIITSGYRSRDYNRRVRGARNSMHMYCAAADVLMPGVSKWEIAQFVRSMPGRGGVGTYCHTNAVHIDVGPERDWNWRCRRRKSS